MTTKLPFESGFTYVFVFTGLLILNIGCDESIDEELKEEGCMDSETRIYDYDCNAYDVIQIGAQYWLKQNLKTTHYSNGTPILTGLTDEEWIETKDSKVGAYAIYEDVTANDDEYGKLYNWFAIANINGLCPTGWHVPSLSEFQELRATLGGADVAGGKMKTILGWLAPNEGADNSSMFSAVPGGHRFFSTGTYGLKNTNATFWTATSSANGGGTAAYYAVLSHMNARLEIIALPKPGGYSCRCVKDK